MNRSTTVFLINKDVMACKGMWEDGGKVELFKTFDRSIKKDDVVVTTSTTRHGFSVVKITEADVGVDIKDDNLSVRWIVAKLDLTEHNEILKNEADAVAKVQQAEFNKMRRDLMDNLVNPEDADAIRALPIYKNGAKPIVEAPAPKPAA